MNKKEAKNRIEELRKQVEYHAKRYYDDDEPEISDFEYVNGRIKKFRKKISGI